MLATSSACLRKTITRLEGRQRSFRDVEEQMAVRGLLAATPSEKALDEIEAAGANCAKRAEVEAAKAELGRTKGRIARPQAQDRDAASKASGRL